MDTFVLHDSKSLKPGYYGATVYSGHAGFFSSNSRDVGGLHSVNGFSYGFLEASR